ncbi:hypothetical protein AB0C10_36445 [Microbispora amethystogenes]|uniref:hypothetical protein n=1 Tax=Microbispora amethystogenes TaxID=1427754 RepID=UPI0033FC917E
MADYAPDAVVHSGTAPNVRSAASGDKLLDPGDHRILRINNGGGSSVTLTINVAGTTNYGVNKPAKTVAIPNGTSRYVLVLAEYGDPTDAGKVPLSWSATTSVTFEYFRS